MRSTPRLQSEIGLGILKELAYEELICLRCLLMFLHSHSLLLTKKIFETHEIRLFEMVTGSLGPVRVSKYLVIFDKIKCPNF